MMYIVRHGVEKYGMIFKSSKIIIENVLKCVYLTLLFR